MRFFTLERLQRQLSDLRPWLQREIREIPMFRHAAGDVPGAEHVDFDDSAWADFPVGEYWGGYDQVAWFRARVSVPEAWRNEDTRLRFRAGPRDGGLSTAEALLFVDGHPLQGIDIWHEQAWLPPEHRGPEILVALRVWSGMYGVPKRRRFDLAQLVRPDRGAERFWHLAENLRKAALELGEHDLRRVTLVNLLGAAMNRVDLFQPGSESFYGSLADAAEQLADGIAELAPDAAAPTVVGVGHGHIDMAWMWQLRHTREKATRTFSTALNLMRQYDEYRYFHSSPQLYRFLMEDQPELYARVKERVAAGQWEPGGGMWIEADTNLPSGESLARQILFGQRFMQREFGRTSRVLWLPDSFGFSWTLPQLMRLGGLDSFSTAILSHSRFSRFPHDTFRWRGLDGSEVLTQIVTTPAETGPSYSYIGRFEPFDIKGAWTNYRHKDLNDELLLPFGWGDGGGGPTAEMLEAGRALRSVPGLPRVTIGSVEGFFADLHQRLEGKDVPVWDGELYLESLRGTYTSQSRTKRANRLAEVLYHDAEWLNVLAGAVIPGRAYPHDPLRQGWEKLLLLQFHDILPGTAIRQVYEDAAHDYAEIQRIGLEAAATAEGAVMDVIDSKAGDVVAFNGLSWSRDDVLALPWSEPLAERPGVQVVGSGDERQVLIETHGVPALGYAVLPSAGAMAAEPDPEWSITPAGLENRFVRVRVDEHGWLTSLFDKVNGREVLAGPANVLELFEDRSIAGEAWEIDLYYREKRRVVEDLVEAVVEEDGPIRGALRLTWRFLSSTISQRLTLYRALPRLDFRTELAWHERQVMLKAAFPVNVRATRATYEIQFGSIERPTHWNTPHDTARFEVPAHRWADLSEGDYGVALLNDCKYGHDVRDNVLRLTLHRSPTEPDESADQGQHVFTYSLLPHAGDWRVGDVVRSAYALNQPLRGRVAPADSSRALPPAFSLVSVDAPNVIVETVKAAEYGGAAEDNEAPGDDEAWVFRVYECWQSRASEATLTFGRPIRRAAACDLLEQNERPAKYQGSRLSLSLRPFEIKTFKVWF